MTITAKVIEDSYNRDSGKRLTTLQVTYPRFIHAELLTHRDKSRNSSSSRAIPVKKMIANTVADPAFFVHIGKNQGGMQAREEVSPGVREQFRAEWLELMHIVASYVGRWAAPAEEGGYNVHKQVANRALEPWQHIHVVLSGTEWDNMDQLRDHKDAQPEFQVLQRSIIGARNASEPRILSSNPAMTHGWHLPYITFDERAAHWDSPRYLARLSAARCARVSYLTHDGFTPEVTKDLELFHRLVGSEPLHASPTEHPAFALPEATRCKNFFGYRQFRADVEEAVF